MDDRPPPSLLSRWRRLDGTDRRMLVEALCFVAYARLAIVTLPFRHVVRLGDTGGPDKGSSPSFDMARLRWAIRAVARHMPFRALCFEQGVAARLMLRRRGIASTLYYGAVREPEGKLATHVWIRAASQDVIGTEACERYSILGIFPS